MLVLGRPEHQTGIGIEAQACGGRLFLPAVEAHAEVNVAGRIELDADALRLRSHILDRGFVQGGTLTVIVGIQGEGAGTGNLAGRFVPCADP